MRWPALILALCVLAGAPFARAADVVSARPDGVGVTVYRDDDIPDPAAQYWGGWGLAMISETRTVDLPAGESRLVMRGVSDGILPQTAALQGLPGTVAEQNFDFDLLSPGSLIQHGLGQTVHVVRTNPKTGRETTEDAVIRSGPDGTVLDFGGRIEALQCSGGLERLVFDRAPPGLTGQATLSTRVRVRTAGRYKLTLAYLTVGLAWKANYVAALSPQGDRLDLTGWITLANHQGTTFANAPTGVVAGRLARQAVQRINAVMARRAAGCWPTGNSHHPHGETLYENEYGDDDGLLRDESTRLYKAGAPPPPPPAPPPPPPPRAQESDLGDYKLYSLNEPTTVAALQTKQVLFLAQQGVKFERVYVGRVQLNYERADADRTDPAVTTLRFVNKPENGLGRALPAGRVSLRQEQDGRTLFLGQPDVRDVSVGSPFELEVGRASDVQVRWRITGLKGARKAGRQTTQASIEVTATSAKGEPVVAEIRNMTAYLTGMHIVAESQAHGVKGGDPVWTLPLAANGEARLTYTVEYQN